MSKRKWANLYAFACIICMVGGYIKVFASAIDTDMPNIVRAIVGFVLGILFATIFHELGHIIFAKTSGMSIAYSKFFCFKIARKGKKLRFGFASPFAADETQAVAKHPENMIARATAYTLGGLIFGGIFLFVVLAVALVTTIWFTPNYLFWGMLPYAAYLFLLNVAPFEYPTGKTDATIALGLKRGEDAEKTMLSAMQIQGELFSAKSYAEIDEKLYFDNPQLPEDEPLFAVMLDLKYRFYLDKGDEKNAADCLNRLVVSQDYLLDEEREKLAAECVYMHSLNGDFEKAEECGKLCRDFLSGETATAKRVLAAYSFAFGNKEAVAPLKAQAERALQDEWFLGNAKFERGLLDKIGE